MAQGNITPGAAVVVVLHAPREKCWGILDEISPAGVFLLPNLCAARLGQNNFVIPGDKDFARRLTKGQGAERAAVTRR
jgi:hypothetical protein